MTQLIQMTQMPQMPQIDWAQLAQKKLIIHFTTKMKRHPALLDLEYKRFLISWRYYFWYRIWHQCFFNYHESALMTNQTKLRIALRNQSFDSNLSPQRSNMLILGIDKHTIPNNKAELQKPIHKIQTIVGLDAIPNLLSKLWTKYLNTQTRHMSLILWLREILALKIMVHTLWLML